MCCVVGILESGWLSSGLSTAHLAENLKVIFRVVTESHYACTDVVSPGAMGLFAGLVQRYQRSGLS